jgi:hypothetical protein
MHPSRLADPGPSPPVFRVVDAAPRLQQRNYPCVARVPLPKIAGGRRDDEGRVDFDGDSWTEVTGSALMFARRSDLDALRFGVKYPGQNGFYWWDGSITDDNVLDRDDAVDYVHAWLEHLFPTATGRIEIFER